MLMAIDASTRKILWTYQTSQQFKASPITYVFDGKQYVALSAGQSVFAFALGE
jgi:alcohol dehydrogenase (cytochrome c)